MQTSKKIWLYSLALPTTAIISVTMVIPPRISQSRTEQNPPKTAKDEKLVVVRETDKQVTLSPGDVLLVKLPARLGTGYSWHAVENKKTLLRLEGKPRTEEIPKKDQEKIKLGGAQYQVFRFVPEKTGKGVLKLEYRRSFEADTPARKAFELEFTICEACK